MGTIRDLVDDSGAVVDRRVYDAFGNIVHNTNAAIDELFGYTGRPFDEATGLQNNLNRWYDPNVGRWISEDPIGFAPGDANLYRYVGNAVVSHIDPFGLVTAGEGWDSDQGWYGWKEAPPESIVPEGWPTGGPTLEPEVDPQSRPSPPQIPERLKDALIDYIKNKPIQVLPPTPLPILPWDSNIEIRVSPPRPWNVSDPFTLRKPSFDETKFEIIVSW